MLPLFISSLKHKTLSCPVIWIPEIRVSLQIPKITISLQKKVSSPVALQGSPTSKSRSSPFPPELRHFSPSAWTTDPARLQLILCPKSFLRCRIQGHIWIPLNAENSFLLSAGTVQLSGIDTVIYKWGLHAHPARQLVNWKVSRKHTTLIQFIIPLKSSTRLNTA